MPAIYLSQLLSPVRSRLTGCVAKPRNQAIAFVSNRIHLDDARIFSMDVYYRANKASLFPQWNPSCVKFDLFVLAMQQDWLVLEMSQPTAPGKAEFDNVREEHLLELEQSSIQVSCTVTDYEINDNEISLTGSTNNIRMNDTSPVLEADKRFSNSSIADEVFMERFTNLKLPFRLWTHDSHLRFAWNVLSTSESLAESILLVRRYIHRYNNHHKTSLSFGYHETITMFYVYMIDHVARLGRYNSFQHMLDNNQWLRERGLIYNFYTKELLFSKEAKASFVDPDIQALPTIGITNTGPDQGMRELYRG